MAAKELKARATSVSNVAMSTPTGKPHQGWFAGHWKWVVMLIVIFLGLLAIAIGASLLQRHLKRKREREAVKAAGGAAPRPVIWGPHQHQSATHGYSYNEGYGSDASIPQVGKGKGKAHQGVTVDTAIYEENEKDARAP